MAESQKSFLDVVRKECAVLLVLLFAGLLLVPAAIYAVGSMVFGDYAGGGFSGFYGDIHSNLRAGQPVVVFLVLSPYLVWQLLRLTARLFRRLRRPARAR